MIFVVGQTAKLQYWVMSAVFRLSVIMQPCYLCNVDMSRMDMTARSARVLCTDKNYGSGIVEVKA